MRKPPKLPSTKSKSKRGLNLNPKKSEIEQVRTNLKMVEQMHTNLKKSPTYGFVDDVDDDVGDDNDVDDDSVIHKTDQDSIRASYAQMKPKDAITYATGNEIVEKE